MGSLVLISLFLLFWYVNEKNIEWEKKNNDGNKF